MSMWVIMVAVSALAAACAIERAKEESKGGQYTMHHYSKIVAFGDGLSDQGQLGLLTGNKYLPSPPFAAGRWTNGPTWVEHLSRLSGIPLAAGDNYAQGGATTGHYNINEPMRSALGLDAQAPIRGVLSQIEAALAVTPKLDPDALYVVWAGGHDIGSWLEYSQPDIVARPPAENIREGLSQLAAAGARHVFLGTMPDMGAIKIAANMRIAHTSLL